MSFESVVIVLDRASGVYRIGQQITGKVVVKAGPKVSTPSSVTITLESAAFINMSPRTVGLFEAFYSSLSPVIMQRQKVKQRQSRPASDLPDAVEFPFNFELKATEETKLMSTYQGKFLNIRHWISCYIGSSFVPSSPKAVKNFVLVTESPSSLPSRPKTTFKSHGYAPRYDEGENDLDLEIDIEGHLETSACLVRSDPLRGQISIIRSTKQIKSIVLHLYRIETCEYSEGAFNDKTEVSSIEVASGNVSRNLAIPIFFMWPRLTTCPSVRHEEFSIAFEMELRINFVSGQYMVETLPVQLF